MNGRRIVFSGPMQVALEDFAVPAPGPGEVLVATEYTVISPGTELSFLLGANNTANAWPQHPGYSGAGRIIAVGSDVHGYAIGDRVVMDHCGHTSHAVCAVAGWRGQGLTRIDDEAIPAAHAAFLPIASMALQGLRKTRPELGESALVAGLGLLGLFAVRLAHLDGAFPLLAVDFNPRRLAIARSFGAEEAWSPDDASLAPRIAELTRGRGLDLIVEVTGAPSALPRLLPLLATQGRISLVGCSREPTDGLDFYRDVHKKGVTIIGAHNYIRPERDSHPGLWTTRDDFRILLGLMARGRLDAGPLISATIPPEQAPAMYRRLLGREEGLLGVVFDWRGAQT
jgi:2-desacetyl-2-hydroxyethyl bacteriochlorophyllide A dehydrogenase